MRVGLAADHAAFTLKEHVAEFLRLERHDVQDFGARTFDVTDDYPDFAIALARAIQRCDVERGIAFCGSGVGACIAGNKVVGVRAALVHDIPSARQGVEDDDMNMLCLGANVIEQSAATTLIRTFLAARFSNATRHLRRLAKIGVLEGSHGPIPMLLA